LITIAGYENGQAIIGHIEVIQTTNDEIGFTTANKHIDTVSDRLIYRVYAMNEVALGILDHPDRIDEGIPGLDDYRRSMKKDKGRSLTVAQLTTLASSLEQLTAKAYPFVVGRTEEVAVFENGSIQTFHELDPSDYELTGPEYGHLMIGLVEGLGATRICSEHRAPRDIGILVMPNSNQIALVNKGHFKCILQPIDKLVVTRTTFDNCLLWYSGDPLSFFGSNNTIMNSKLLVDSRVGMSSPFILNFKRNYPDVQIVTNEEDW
jgi:hypothetical protein